MARRFRKGDRVKIVGGEHSSPADAEFVGKEGIVTWEGGNPYLVAVAVDGLNRIYDYRSLKRLKWYE